MHTLASSDLPCLYDLADVTAATYGLSLMSSGLTRTQTLKLSFLPKYDLRPNLLSVELLSNVPNTSDDFEPWCFESLHFDPTAQSMLSRNQAYRRPCWRAVRSWRCVGQTCQSLLTVCCQLCRCVETWRGEGTCSIQRHVCTSRSNDRVYSDNQTHTQTMFSSAASSASTDAFETSSFAVRTHQSETYFEDVEVLIESVSAGLLHLVYPLILN